MKRILLAFASIVSVIWFLPCFVHAYTGPDGNEYLYKVNASTGNQSTLYFTVYSNNKMCTVDGNSYYGGKRILGIFANQQDGRSVCDIAHSGGTTVSIPSIVRYPSNTNVNSSLDNGYRDFYNNSNDMNWGTYYLTDYNCNNDAANLPNFSNFEDAFNYLNAPEVDYDDLIFDPSIPVPKFISVYGILPLWNLGGSVTPQFPIQTIFSSMPSYNVEVQVRYYSPSKITFSGSRRSALSEDWTIKYNYDSLMPSEWYPLVTMQDNIQNDELALNDSDYYYSWNNFITGYDSELIEFVLDPVFISPSANTSIKAYAETEYAKMRNIGGCYGNEFEIMARNYYVNNGNVYVGNWFHWNSLSPDSGTAEYSSDAITDNEVNGVQNVVNSNDLPTGNSLTTIGEPTGNTYNPTNNIIIQSSVPNYPDYPTVSDYNRDNILVNMIKTSQSMPQYFGQFNDFLKVAFSFIDPSVWAVISLGFMASIVIMVIKVL